MRDLIDVAFQDTTSYPSQVAGDVGGIVIDCPWGPTDSIERVNLAQFLSKFPLPKVGEVSISHLTAFVAFLSGMNTIEVVRIGSGAAYISTLLKTGGTNSVKLKYKGHPVEFLDTTRHYKIKVTSSTSATEGKVITVQLYYLTLIAGATTPDLATEAGYDKTIVETVEGGITPGQLVDGKDFYLGTKLDSSVYFSGEDISGSLDAEATAIATTPVSYLITPAVITAAYSVASSTSDLAEEYATYFSDIEDSEVSILIDPGVTTSTEANLIIAVAAARTDCVALVGYPTSESWITESTDGISDYKDELTPSMMAAFYACREAVKYSGRVYSLNGIGRIAGRYAYVASQESVNQLPSAKTWGAFGGVLTEKTSFAQVLDWHNSGINSVYSTSKGPRIFGLRSLHPRESSYYSRFNVGRVVARILKYGFGVAMDVIHTGNTATKKALAQTLLNTDLNTLKGKGVLGVQSSVRCDAKNNLDSETNGGKILKIDYTCYFVSLIEKVSITITATDSSVSATVNNL